MFLSAVPLTPRTGLTVVWAAGGGLGCWGCWGCRGEFNLDAGRVDRLEGQLRDKLLQKKKERETEARCLVAAFRYFNTAGTNMVDSRCFARTVERFGLVLEEPEMEAWFSYYDKVCPAPPPTVCTSVLYAPSTSRPRPSQTALCPSLPPLPSPCWAEVPCWAAVWAEAACG